MDNNIDTNCQDRPLITFALFAYNQEQYIEEAVRGAFSQTYSPLEIILSDDCSTDHTFEIMERLATEYQGPHTIVLNRNEPNLRLCPHINKVFGMASGEIIVVAAGDDISLPDRVKQSWKIFDQHPEVVSVSLQFINIDEKGARDNKKRMAYKEGEYSLGDYIQGKRPPVLGATRAYKREVVELFGPLSSRCEVEDATLIFRALLIGSLWHHSVDGVMYRRHDQCFSKKLNYSTAKNIFRQNISDVRFAVTKDLLVEFRVSDIVSVARRRLAHGIISEKFDRSATKILYFTFVILPSRLFSGNEKKTYLKKLLKQARRKSLNG